MSKPKLYYFNGQGRAEVTRIMFNYGGVEFEDVRLVREKWLEYKPNTPFGQMPVLEMDGLCLCQSIAIEGYVGKKVGLAGKNDGEFAQCNMIANCAADMMKPLMDTFSEKDEVKKAEMKKEYGETTIHPFLQKFEKMINKGHFIGDKLSWPDLKLHALLTSMVVKFGVTKDLPGNKIKLDDYPNIQAVIKNVDDDKKVQDYFSKRPDTSF